MADIRQPHHMKKIGNYTLQKGTIMIKNCPQYAAKIGGKKIWPNFPPAGQGRLMLGGGRKITENEKKTMNSLEIHINPISHSKIIP